MGISQIPAASAAGLTQQVAEFATSGTFATPASVSTVEVLLVAGGGGGGGAGTGFNAGGGGGGGQVVKKLISVVGGTSYTVTIGGGGAGGANDTASGTTGTNSSFGSLLICGGGGGGGCNSSRGGTAGNAGTNAYGGGHYASPMSAVTRVDGVVGGSNGGSMRDSGATGGGGAGGGNSSPSTQAGNAVTASGMAGIGLYGFGAGGAAITFENNNTVGKTAAANTGSGGGGAGASGSNNAGGAGGSGYCIVSYWAQEKTMAHFAELDNNNVVLQVVVIANKDTSDENGVEQEAIGIAFCKSLYGADTKWIQTSYNGNIRGQYCGLGWSYDAATDVFLPPKPYASWLRDDLSWKAPKPRPEGKWTWNEETLSWDEEELN